MPPVFINEWIFKIAQPANPSPSCKAGKKIRERKKKKENKKNNSKYFLFRNHLNSSSRAAVYMLWGRPRRWGSWPSLDTSEASLPSERGGANVVVTIPVAATLVLALSMADAK